MNTTQKLNLMGAIVGDTWMKNEAGGSPREQINVLFIGEKQAVLRVSVQGDTGSMIDLGEVCNPALNGDGWTLVGRNIGGRMGGSVAANVIGIDRTYERARIEAGHHASTLMAQFHPELDANPNDYAKREKLAGAIAELAWTQGVAFAAGLKEVAR